MIEIDEQRKKQKKLREEQPWRFQKQPKLRRQLVWYDDDGGVGGGGVDGGGTDVKPFAGNGTNIEGSGGKQRVRQRRRRQGRNLQGYIGKAVGAETMDMALHTEEWMAWTTAWDERIPDRATGNPICEKLYQDFESRVNDYGYSLKHPEVVKIPKSLEDHILIPRAQDLHTSELAKFKRSLGAKLEDEPLAGL